MSAIGIISAIKGIFKPAAKLVDNLHTSPEEKMTLINELANAEFQIQAKVLEYETKILEVQASTITTEAKGESWLQRNWRPLTMLSFLILILLSSFGLFSVALAPEIWGLLKLGIGGYTIGRSLEKIAPQFKDIILVNKKSKRKNE
jgi:hypothetical protein